MIAQAAGMDARGHEGMAQAVHLQQWRRLAGIPKIIGVDSSGQGRAGLRLDGYHPQLALARQLVL